MAIWIDLLTERVEWCDSLRFEVFLESCKHRTNTIDKGIPLNSFLELHSAFEIVDLSEEWEEYLR